MVPLLIASAFTLGAGFGVAGTLAGAAVFVPRRDRVEDRLGRLERADRTAVHLFNRHGWLEGRLIVPEPDVIPIGRFRGGRDPSDAA